jgi:hypothetical protein
MPMTEFRWKGFLMGAVVVEKHRQIHLWAPTAHGNLQSDNSLCSQLSWRRDVVDGGVTTGWPDCNGCIQEGFKRMVKVA